LSSWVDDTRSMAFAASTRLYALVNGMIKGVTRAPIQLQWNFATCLISWSLSIPRCTTFAQNRKLNNIRGVSHQSTSIGYICRQARCFKGVATLLVVRARVILIEELVQMISSPLGIHKRSEACTGPGSMAWVVRGFKPMTRYSQ
jgi:hypothetical protein